MESRSHRYRYDAFISYSSADARVAARLQRYIESYRLPRGRVPLRVFRDATDIRSGSISNELRSALATSRALVVCCSLSAAESAWVAEEIDVFTRLGNGGPVLLALVADAVPDGMPEAVRSVDSRYADLRGGWLMGRMRTKAQIESVRLIAAIADVELRELIPWDRRLRRRRAAVAATVGLAVTGSVLVFPFRSTRQLDVAAPQRFGVVEHCDVTDGRLTLSVRAGQGDRDYVALFSDALGDPERWTWLDETAYVPSRRLLGSDLLPGEFVERALATLDMDALVSRAQTIARELNEEFIPGFAEAGSLSDFVPEIELREGFWIGEPRPGLFVAVVAITAVPEELLVDLIGIDTVYGVVGVAQTGGATRVAELAGLSPRNDTRPAAGRRGAALGSGLPLVVLDDAIWLGAPVDAEGRVGGLWRSGDGGETWVVQRVHDSVFSLLSDPRPPVRLLLAAAPGAWSDPGGRRGDFSTVVLERREGDAEWQPVEDIAAGSDSVVQLCGLLDDATLVTRVDQYIYATGRTNLLFRWFTRTG